MSIIAEIREKEKISVKVGFGSVNIKEKQVKTVEITENGVTEIVSDENKILEKVIAEVNVFTKEEQEKTLSITENGTYEVLPDENKVFSKLNVEVDVLGGDVEEYKGSYDVTPSLQDQILPTSLKVMRNDITIQKIPYSEVTNTAGGKTIIIA